jgi:hypothetical protein
MTVHMLAERIAHERELREQTEAFVKRALEKADVEYAHRLEEKLSLTMATYERRHEFLEGEIDKLTAWKDQLTGKLVAGGVALGIGFTLLGLFMDKLFFNP